MPPIFTPKSDDSVLKNILAKITIGVIVKAGVFAITATFVTVYHRWLQIFAQSVLQTGLTICVKIGTIAVEIFVWLFTSKIQISFWIFSLLIIAAGKLAIELIRYYRSEYGKPSWWRSYVEDKFFHVKWEWLYERDGEIFNLSPHCPDDGSSLKFKDDFIEDKSTGKRTAAISLKCEKCGKKFGPFAGEKADEIYTEVKKKILEELRSKKAEWDKMWKKFMRGDFRFDSDRRRLMSEEEIRAEELAFSKRLSEQQPKIYARAK